ncbi:MAG: 6-carboxytetrahydropterin synthase QueD [bacterium]
MFEVSVEASFSSAHQLRGYKGKCENLHGHNWKVEAVVRSERVDDLGMVIDFQKLKGSLHQILEELDHRNLNDLPPFINQNPSSENIAAYLYRELKKKVSCAPARITVWESEKCSATYFEVSE